VRDNSIQMFAEQNRIIREQSATIIDLTQLLAESTAAQSQAFQMGYDAGFMDGSCEGGKFATPSGKSQESP
jgi:hypothetical protein